MAKRKKIELAAYLGLASLGIGLTCSLLGNGWGALFIGWGVLTNYVLLGIVGWQRIKRWKEQRDRSPRWSPD